MEFCNYSDLESYYNKHAPLNTSDMNIILQQLANGLQLLCSNGIIHRDLKPEVSLRDYKSFRKIRNHITVKSRFSAPSGVT